MKDLIYREQEERWDWWVAIVLLGFIVAVITYPIKTSYRKIYLVHGFGGCDKAAHIMTSRK